MPGLHPWPVRGALQHLPGSLLHLQAEELTKNVVWRGLGMQLVGRAVPVPTVPSGTGCCSVF